LDVSNNKFLKYLFCITVVMIILANY